LDLRLEEGDEKHWGLDLLPVALSQAAFVYEPLDWFHLIRAPKSVQRKPAVSQVPVTVRNTAGWWSRPPRWTAGFTETAPRGRPVDG